MKRLSPWKTVRGRLLLLAIGIEIVMLSTLVANSLRLFHGAMMAQARVQVEQMHPVIAAALTAPMAQQDYATVQAVIDESRAAGGIDFIAVEDNYGNRISSSGWPKGVPLPAPETSLSPADSKMDPLYSVMLPIAYHSQRLGTLHFGLNLSQIIAARNNLLAQGVSIAGLEIILSSIMLLFLGYRITRHLTTLTEASIRVASGSVPPPLVPEGDDDVGQLGIAFNTMARVISDRVRELTEAKEAAETASEQLRHIPSRLIAAQEEERRRLASELHDSISQTLAALKFRMEHMLLIAGRGKTKRALRLAEEFVPALQLAIDETRAIYMGLRPKVLEDFGVIAALHWYRDELIKLHPQQHIELEIGIEENEVSTRLVIPIFRIAQEALNNASKHSRAEWIDVSLFRNGGGIELIISDDGQGMDLDYILRSTTSRSLGLVSMRERAELTGGKFRIKSIPGEGTMVQVQWTIVAGEYPAPHLA